jgi:hypothetical protein
MSNSTFRAYDLGDLRVYSLEEEGVMLVASSAWGLALSEHYKKLGWYYSVNCDYFTPDLDQHILTAWKKQP